MSQSFVENDAATDRSAQVGQVANPSDQSQAEPTRFGESRKVRFLTSLGQRYDNDCQLGQRGQDAGGRRPEAAITRQQNSEARLNGYCCQRAIR